MGLVRPDDEQRGRSIEVIRLELELKQQAKRYIELGFHKELGFTEKEYLESLPKFFTQPEGYKERFGTPLLVETRIPMARLAILSGIEDFSQKGFKDFDLLDWEGDPQKFRTPNKPYTTWLNNGKMKFKESIDMVRANLREDERMTTIFDGIALYISQPEIFEIHDILCGGSVFESSYVPLLGTWYNIPCLEITDTNKPVLECGSVVCGRKLGFKE